MAVDCVDTLIIASPGRFRDSLSVLLRAGELVSLVGQADNGVSGLKMIDALRPNLVLMDADLPNGDTWDVLEHIKRTWPQVRCLILAHTQQQERDAQTAAADSCLRDGFTTEILFGTLRDLINDSTPIQLRSEILAK